MLDWLNFTIELQHKTIPNGSCIIFDENGEITRGFDTKRFIEGSFDSRVAVISTSALYWYSEAMLTLGLYNGKDGNGESSAVSFVGNPAKYLQGHNIIGTSCLRALAIGVVSDIFPKLGFTNLQLEEAISKIVHFNFWVTKVDITHLYDFGSNENVVNFMSTLPQTLKARGDRVSHEGNTVYVGKRSGLWAFKFYNKYIELQSPKKVHRLNSRFENTGLLDFAKGKLRAELVLHKKQLERLNVLHASKLQGEIDNLFNTFLGRFTMTNQRVNKAKLQSLGIRHQNTYYRWQQGEMPVTFLSKSAYYRHRSTLLEIGVDIALAPIIESERTFEIEPLPQVLSPKVVKLSDVPKNLIPYLVQPFKNNNIRIA